MNFLPNFTKLVDFHFNIKNIKIVELNFKSKNSFKAINKLEAKSEDVRKKIKS